MPQLFDDGALNAHILKLQGKLAPPKPQRAPKKEKVAVGSLQGIVTKWFDDRQFGFIATSGDDIDDCFVGSKALAASGLRSLARGDRVRFDRVPSKRKSGAFEATNISMAEAA